MGNSIHMTWLSTLQSLTELLTFTSIRKEYNQSQQPYSRSYSSPWSHLLFTLPPRRRVLKNLIAGQLVRNLHDFYGTRKYNIIFTSQEHIHFWKHGFINDLKWNPKLIWAPKESCNMIFLTFRTVLQMYSMQFTISSTWMHHHMVQQQHTSIQKYFPAKDPQDMASLTLYYKNKNLKKSVSTKPRLLKTILREISVS